MALGIRRFSRPLCSIALSACFSLLAAPAYADLDLNNGANGSYSVGVMSWSEIPFRSVVRQQYDFSCGSAAVATLLTYHYGARTPEQQVFASMWERGNQDMIRKAGFSMLDMKQYLDGLGYSTDGYRFTIDTLRKVERPGIVLLDLKGYKHFVVVKGVRGNRILVGDPMLGLSEYSVNQFKSIWNGIYLAVADTAQKRKPAFNLAGDWGPWSSAPMDDLGLRVPVASLTDGIGEIYQIIPKELVLDVRALANR